MFHWGWNNHFLILYWNGTNNDLSNRELKVINAFSWTWIRLFMQIQVSCNHWTVALRINDIVKNDFQGLCDTEVFYIWLLWWLVPKEDVYKRCIQPVIASCNTRASSKPACAWHDVGNQHPDEYTVPTFQGRPEPLNMFLPWVSSLSSPGFCFCCPLFHYSSLSFRLTLLSSWSLFRFHLNKTAILTKTNNLDYFMYWYSCLDLSQGSS